MNSSLRSSPTNTVLIAGRPIWSFSVLPLNVVAHTPIFGLPPRVSDALGTSTTMDATLVPLKKSTVLASQNVRPDAGTAARQACS